MRVRPTGGLVGKWLGHEGGVVAKLARNKLDAVLEGEAQVACLQSFMWPIVDLELSGAILAVSRDNVDADVRHQFDDALCYRHGSIAHGVEDVQSIENRLHRGWIEQVKLVL